MDGEITCLSVETFPDKIVKKYSNGVTVIRPVLTDEERERRIKNIQHATWRFFMAVEKRRQEKERKMQHENIN